MVVLEDTSPNGNIQAVVEQDERVAYFTLYPNEETGEPVKSCTVLTPMAGGHEVRTVEDLERGSELDPVQQGFMECHGLQCGFCTPGMLLTARALLDAEPDPDDHRIREAISGQICRCTGYTSIVRSVRWAAEHEARARQEVETR